MAVDKKAPVVTAFAITPGAIDTAYQPASFSIELNVSDDLSGIQSVAIWFVSPDGTPAVGANIWNFTGSSKQRVYSETFEVAQYSDIGDYSVTVELVDNAGNVSYIYDLDKLFKTNLIITSGSDGVVSGNTLYIGSSTALGAAQNNLRLTGTRDFYGTGNAADNVIYGNSGNNKLSGLVGNDRLIGGAGDDVLIGGVGGDKLEGGAGIDTASYTTATKGVVASLASPSINTNDAKVDSYVSIENLTGSAFDDTLYGNAGNNVLSGGAGKDVLSGGDGNDTYVLRNESDTVKDTGGVDTITSIITRSIAGHATIENLTLLGSANINGSGNSLANAITGNSSGNVLNGNDGNDTIKGGRDGDALTGGKGRDYLYGEAGNDTFVYKSSQESTTASPGRDTIYDLSKGDRIDLSAIDANAKTTKNDAFSFISDKAFTGKVGELRFDKVTSDTYVYGDTNGDGKANFAIHLDDAISLTKDYFVL